MPTIAAALAEAEESGVDNFLILPGSKLIEPPLRALLGDEAVQVDGFLLPGHVSVIIGSDAYGFLAEEYGVPSAVVGFAPVDVLSGVEVFRFQFGRGTGWESAWHEDVPDRGLRGNSQRDLRATFADRYTGPAVYYCRVRQKHLVRDRPVYAWSTPIWVGEKREDT